ncbi:hypothetical protein ScPMuIL_014922 [Solemya velum]
MPFVSQDPPVVSSATPNIPNPVNQAKSNVVESSSANTPNQHNSNVAEPISANANLNVADLQSKCVIGVAPRYYPDQNICSLQEFQCNTSLCISRDKVCNLNEDCIYGEDEAQDCDALPRKAKCTFDFPKKMKKKEKKLEDMLCGWHNIDGIDTFNWTHIRGATPSDSTGPEFDHTTKSKKGYYVFIEANGKGVGDIAVLESVVFPPPPPETTNKTSPYYGSCHVQFFYHMLGAHINQLKLEVKEICHSPPKHYTILKLDDRNVIFEWQYAAVPLTSITGRFQLHFAGFAPFRYQGDIAIDDVSLSPECFGLGILENVTKSGDYGEWLSTRKDLPFYKNCSNSILHHEDTPSTVVPDQVSQTTPYFEIPGGPNRQHQTYRFTSCGQSGRFGPLQSECEEEYMNTNTHITINENFPGVQKWEVPLTADYKISVYGAQGGTTNGTTLSYGGHVEGQFSLTGGDYLYILVGQEGSNACTINRGQDVNMPLVTNRGHKNAFCHFNLTEGGPKDHDTPVGGAGGGGATFVFKVQMLSNVVIPLLVAGGGGGLAYEPQDHDLHSVCGGCGFEGPAYSALTKIDSPGGGGGWNGTKTYTQAGQSLLENGAGGAPCPLVDQNGWTSDGGFGGGGGGCFAGGVGVDTEVLSGVGGSSYHSPDAISAHSEPGVNAGDGYAELTLLYDCYCQYWCSIVDAMKPKIECKCPPNTSLSTDGNTCLKTPLASRRHNNTSDSGFRKGDITAIAITGVVVTLLSIGVIVCVVNQRKRRRELHAMRMEMFENGSNIQISNPIPTPQTAASALTNGIVMEYNPNYDFVVAKYTENQLREVPRHKLRLSRGLGQGAFGEVYQGYLGGVVRVEGELPVAVKTLPALCTELAEMDFYMEAVIMSKFKHPNIVKFLGVCFEEHPRYIILELLEGGDLKTFLRESRPKPDCPSVLCVKDLLKLALDIAKGCQHLEESHFIHRDIAARNCLLTCKGADRVAKIADFGMARDIYRADYYKKGGKAMLPIKWMPPEAFLDGIFTTKTDTWSYGILLWEIFAMGYMPYPGRTNQDVMQFVTSGGRLEPPENCPTVIYQLMSICWAAIPETRPTFTDIIEQLERFVEDPIVLESKLPDFKHFYTKDGERQVVRPKNPQDLLTICNKSVPNQKYDSFRSESCEPLIGMTRLSDINEETEDYPDDSSILNDDDQVGEFTKLFQKGTLCMGDSENSFEHKETFTDGGNEGGLLITDYLTPDRMPLLSAKPEDKSEPPISEMKSVLPEYINIYSEEGATGGLNTGSCKKDKEKNGFFIHIPDIPENDALRKRKETIQRIFEHKV